MLSTYFRNIVIQITSDNYLAIFIKYKRQTQVIFFNLEQKIVNVLNKRSGHRTVPINIRR